MFTMDLCIDIESPARWGGTALNRRAAGGVKVAAGDSVFHLTSSGVCPYCFVRIAPSCRPHGLIGKRYGRAAGVERAPNPDKTHAEQRNDGLTA